MDASEHFIKNLNNFFLQPQNISVTSYQPAQICPKVVRLHSDLEDSPALYHHFTGEIVIRNRNQTARATPIVSRPRQRALQAALQDLRLFIKPN